MEVHTLADAVRRAAARPDAPALVAGDTVTTWGALDARADRVAAALAALALPGDGAPARVAVALPAGRELVEVLIGVWRAGLTGVPVDPAAPAREIAHILADAQPAALVTTGTVATGLATGLIPGPASLSQTYVLGPRPGGTRPYAQLVASDEPPPLPGVGGEDIALLRYGMGGSRAALVSHRALLARLLPGLIEVDDVVLVGGSLVDALGLLAGSGARGVLLPGSFSAATSLHTIAEHRATVVLATPPMFAAWAEHRHLAEPLATVRTFLCVGGPLDPAVARRFPRHIRETYGRVEAGLIVAAADADTLKIGSVGPARLELTLHTGPDGAVPEPGRPGEITLRGESLFSGYWPSGADGPSLDGWWASGDMAYVDDDGDLFLVDRLDARIMVDGVAVYPREVELVLATHPGVAEVAVVAIAADRGGSAPKAYVVAAAPEITPEQLASHAARHLAAFQCPVEYEFVDALPTLVGAAS